jgi:ParB/RepB/Spo0J family partition protein
MLAIEHLRIPENYVTTPRKVDDEILRNSIKLTGVQQPLVVVRISDTDYWVVDGIRRLRIAQSLGITELPCVLDHGVEDIDDGEAYRNRIRFILDEHRQDLLPTQRAALIKKLQESFELTGKQVGLYLGVTPGTIANWTLIDKLIPELQKAIDDGKLNLHTSRAFAGMTCKGQKEVWEKHQDAVVNMSGGRLHRFVRETYLPAEFPGMYESPETAMRQLTRKSQPRRARKREVVSVTEKKALLRDVDAKKIELEDKQSQIKEFNADIEAAIPVIKSLRQNKSLWENLPAAVRADFEEFASRYID